MQELNIIASMLIDDRV